MKRIILSAIFVATVVLVSAVQSRAGEVDALLDVLVDKGYLTTMEASIVKDEAKQNVAKEKAKEKSNDLPQWVQNLKIKQDLRLRYQYSEKQNDANSRNRARFRYRLGLESKVADQVKLFAGIATGGDDPRSTNQSFDQYFDSPDVRLDYAYADLDLSDNVEQIDSIHLAGGKLNRKLYLWAPTDLLWDGDIRPEGFSASIKSAVNDKVNGFLNSGVWILDENSGAPKDPWMLYVQAGATAKIGDENKVDVKTAVTYYDFFELSGAAPDNCAGTNTGITAGSGSSCSGALVSQYDSIVASAEIGFNKPFEALGGGDLADIFNPGRISVFGDFVSNINDSNVSETTGFAAGLKYGDKKVSKPGTWQMKYIFARLEADAFPDIFPDSDRLGGKTNVKSHEAILQYAWKKNVIFGIDYYHSDVIKGTSNSEDLIQVDMLFKF